TAPWVSYVSNGGNANPGSIQLQTCCLLCSATPTSVLSTVLVEFSARVASGSPARCKLRSHQGNTFELQPGLEPGARESVAEPIQYRQLQSLSSLQEVHQHLRP